MTRIIVATNPAHDRATEYLSSWFEKIVEFALKQKHTLIRELKGIDVNRKNLTDIVSREKPKLIIFNGHGDENSIFGFEENIIVQHQENESITNGAIVHCMACESGKVLGGACIASGAVSFIGYKEKVHLFYLKNSLSGEEKSDPIAAFFLEPAYEPIISLIKGETTREAYDKSQKMYKENLLALVTSKNEDYNTVVASHLFKNFQNQVCLGNQGASF